MQQTRGRPRSFDRDEALRLAMQVFWNKGYEGTTMADLTAAIGVKAPSLYAAFGDKNALFREAIDFYSATTAIGPMNALKEGKGMREDLHNMLQTSVALYADPANGKGCMVVVSAINCAPENAAHAEEMAVRRQKKRQELAKRFRKAQERPRRFLYRSAARPVAERTRRRQLRTSGQHDLPRHEGARCGLDCAEEKARRAIG
jgi:AcrR family transcriptional regulator